MSVFLAYVASQCPGEHVLMFLDGAGWHRAHERRLPPTLKLRFLPPIQSGTQSRRAALAAPARELSGQSRLRHLGRGGRFPLCRPRPTHSPARNRSLHRLLRLAQYSIYTPILQFLVFLRRFFLNRAHKMFCNNVLQSFREGGFSAYGLQPTACSLQPAACSLQPTAYSLQPAAYSLKPRLAAALLLQDVKLP